MKKVARFGLGLGMAVVAAAALTGCGAGSDAVPATAAQPSVDSPSARVVGGEPGIAAPPPPVAAEAPAAAPKGDGASAGRGRAEKSADRAEVARRPESAPQPVDRPGLGTEWGETRLSRIDTVSFFRAEPSAPFAASGIFYNDEQGARAMASAEGFRRTASGPIALAGGAVSVGLRDESGRFLSGYAANGKDFVVGESGQRYTIVLRNNTDLRFEAVMSVDGLDVMDGKDASFKKRGYIIDPRSELEVDGFRQSTETVAAFRFGSVRNSYANQKHGETRNVGIIGVALFHERGTNPFAWTNSDVSRREHANPFPGQFASPP